MSRSSTLAMCIALCFLAPARAAIITVTSDSGGTGGPDCTIRDAITAANTDTPTGGCPAGNGADTIELPANATITLTEVDNETNGPNGLPSVTGVLTINGSTTAIQREGTAPEFRIFHIGDSGNVTLSGLSVSNGFAGGEHRTGGGIYNKPSGILAMTNCVVSGNTALRGGGIYDWGVTTLSNCTIGENTALSGGGILSVGELLTLIDCAVIDNMGNGVESAHGPGGLTTMIITNCTVSGNSTSGRGGGIVNSGTLTLSNSNVDGNTADRGGGVANFWIMRMIDSTVSGNTADASEGVGQGGGIYNTNFGQPAVLIVINSNVIGNSAGEFRSGGGIYSDGDVTLIDSNVIGNSARSGSGIYNFHGTVTMTNSSVNWNSATFGGGIHNYQGTVSMSNSTADWNSASNQGGGIQNFQGMVTLSNSTVNWNSASDGGGIYNYQGAGTLTLITSTVSHNSAAQDGGGIHNRSTLVLTSSTVSDNTAGGFLGGGIFNHNLGTVTLAHSIVANSTNAADCDNFGVVIDTGHNIVEDGSCISAPTSFSGDPMLGPLQDNGGPTMTHALPEGSPAIDTIPVGECVVDTDQRGVRRPQGDGCDIGSYELELADPCADDDGDGRVTICHVPPGNPGNAHTITVSVNALPKHLAHGDTCGPCADGLPASAGGPATGSCCYTEKCFVVTEEDCAAIGGTYVGDGTRCVGPFDLAQLLGWWGPCEPADPCHEVDADANGDIGPFDLAVVLGGWGPCP